MIKKFLYFLLFLNFLLAILFWINKGREKWIFYGDGLGYHMYLPATFIYNKLLTLSEITKDTTLPESIKNDISSLKNAYTNVKGEPIIQYTYGTALMYSPGFFVMRMIDKISKATPSTGYEMRYQNATKLCGMIYVFLALLLLSKLIKKYYHDNFSLISILVLLFGTNLFWFTFYQAGMAHIPLFFLNASLIYLTDLIYEHDCKIKHLLLFAIILGLIFLLRPTDIVVIIAPLLYNIKSDDDIKQRISFFKKHFFKIVLLCSTVLFIVVFPQIYYWYSMTGDWLYDSYGNQEFRWTKPEILKGLFSGRNGWLAYSPIMVLSIIGLFIKKKSNLNFALYFLLPIYIYIIYSWWCWNYINGFGSRPMIHLYPYLIFPILTLLQASNKIWKVILSIFMLASIVVNLMFTYKATKDELRPDESRNIFNYTTMFKKTLDVEDLNLLDVGIYAPENIVNNKGELLIEVFADSNKVGFDTLNQDKEYSKVILEYFIKQEDLDYGYLRIGGEFLAPNHVHVTYNSCVLTTTIERNGKQIDWIGLSINNKLGKKKLGLTRPITISETIVNELDSAYFHLPINKLRLNDKVRVVVWNASKNGLLVKKLYITRI